MLIRHFMTYPVFRVKGSETVAEVWRQFEENGIRRAPVMTGNKVMGMITQHDLLRAMPKAGLIGYIDEDEEEEAEGLSTWPVRSLVKRKLLWIGPNDHIDSAAAIMLKQRVDSLPVLDEGELVGMLTSSDLFELFSSAGTGGDSRRLSIKWPTSDPEPDALRALFAEGTRLHGLVRHATPGGRTISVLHISPERFDEVKGRLVSMGFVVVEIEKRTRRR